MSNPPFTYDSRNSNRSAAAGGRQDLAGLTRSAHRALSSSVPNPVPPSRLPVSHGRRSSKTRAGSAGSGTWRAWYAHAQTIDEYAVVEDRAANMRGMTHCRCRMGRRFD